MTDRKFTHFLPNYRKDSYAVLSKSGKPVDIVPYSGKLRSDGTLLAFDEYEHVTVKKNRLLRWSYRANKWVHVRSREWRPITEIRHEHHFEVVGYE